MKEFKLHFNKLSQGHILSLDDPYWSKYGQAPISGNMLQELGDTEIVTVRDANVINFKLLIYTLSSELIPLLTTKVLTQANKTKIITLIKLLIKFIPYLFQLGDFVIKSVFVNSYDPLQHVLRLTTRSTTCIKLQSQPQPRPQSHSLAESLIGAIVSHLNNYELSPSHIAVWEPGIIINGKYEIPNLVTEAHRSLVMGLLLVVCSDPLYSSPMEVVRRGSILLPILITITKSEISQLTTSLVNVVIRSTGPESMTNFGDMIIKTGRYTYINNCIQLLALTMIYPSKTNEIRIFLSKLNKLSDILLLGSSLVNGLKTEGGNPWNEELIMLLWGLYQINGKFKVLISRKFYSDICLVLVQLIKNNKCAKLGSLFLLHLTQSESATDYLMNYDDNMETPRDLIVMQLCSVLPRIKDNLISRNLVYILYNVIPLISSHAVPGTNDHERKFANKNPKGGLSYGGCMALTNLVLKFSARGYLLSNSEHNDYLALLIRAILMAGLNCDSGRMLLFSFIKNERVYEQANFVISGLNECFVDGKLVSVPYEKVDDNDNKPEPQEPLSEPNEWQQIEQELQPTVPCGLSKRSKSKFAKDAPISKTFGGLQALEVIVRVIIPYLKYSVSQLLEGRIDTFEIIEHLEKVNLKSMLQNYYIPIYLRESKPVEFSWNQMSLTWYLLFLYHRIFYSHDYIRQILGTKNKLILNITSMMTWKIFNTETKYTDLETIETIQYVTECSYSKFPTLCIRLFQVEETVGFFELINSKLTTEKPRLNRRLSDLRLTGANSGHSTPNRTPQQEVELYFPSIKRGNSVSSLQSLNTLNRSRTNTPRNSISM